MLHFFPSRYASNSTTYSFVRDFRGIIALGLAALLFLASLSVPARAQEPASSSKVPAGDQFILYQNPEGEVVCREATLARHRPQVIHQGAEEPA